MKTLKRIELNMGEIRRTELVDYFLEIGKESADFHRFTGQGWEVEVGDEFFEKFGAFGIRRVIVEIRVEEELFQDFLEKFRLRFLRAGG